ncbi:MAG: hypothetical protein ABWZ30_05510 [Jiangellaceae bacterium]
MIERVEDRAVFDDMLTRPLPGQRSVRRAPEPGDDGGLRALSAWSSQYRGG